jgi:hypothetical protein
LDQSYAVHFYHSSQRTQGGESIVHVTSGRSSWIIPMLYTTTIVQREHKVGKINVTSGRSSWIISMMYTTTMVHREHKVGKINVTSGWPSWISLMLDTSNTIHSSHMVGTIHLTSTGHLRSVLCCTLLSWLTKDTR